MLKDVLRESRTALRMKQEDVAKQVKVSKQTYLKWENGTTEPRASQVQLLSEILNITPNEICKGKLNARYSFDQFIRQKALVNAHLEVELLMLWQLIPDHEEYINALAENHIYGSNSQKVLAGAVNVRGILSDLEYADSDLIRNPLTSGQNFWTHNQLNKKVIERLFENDPEFQKEREQVENGRTPPKHMNAHELKAYLLEHDPEEYNAIFVKGGWTVEDLQDALDEQQKN